MNTFTYDVTIYYRHRDLKYAEELVRVLQSAGLRVWFDRPDIQGGNYQTSIFELSEAIDSSKYVISLLGAGEPDQWVQSECSPMLRVKPNPPSFKLIPVLAPGAKEPSGIYNAYKHFDLRDWSVDKLRELALLLLRSDLEHEERFVKPRIFLCHAKEDSNRAHLLYGALKKEKLDPWYDKAELVIGDNWHEEIIRAIEKSDFFAILLSQVATKKVGFINREIRLAIRELQRRQHGMAYLLPIRLEECEIPKIRLDENTELADLQWLDIFDNNSETIRQLVIGIWKQWKKKLYSS